MVQIETHLVLFRRFQPAGGGQWCVGVKDGSLPLDLLTPRAGRFVADGPYYPVTHAPALQLQAEVRWSGKTGQNRVYSFYSHERQPPPTYQTSTL